MAPVGLSAATTDFTVTGAVAVAVIISDKSTAADGTEITTGRAAIAAVEAAAVRRGVDRLARLRVRRSVTDRAHRLRSFLQSKLGRARRCFSLAHM